VTLNDITDFRRSEQQLSAAKQAAEQANLAKSRFLAAASHDLRQPLQTLTLLHDVLHGRLADEKAAELAWRAQETLDSMSGMLDALLDINQLEAGAIRPDLVDFPVDAILDKLKTQFAYHASARGLDWRVVPSRLAVHSDPHLLEQMVRNLVSNAIRYTAEGKVLLGCRRRGDKLRIEVWDTGVGIAEEEIPRIFEEYHQAPGDAGEGGGLGLGLAIVQRMGQLLGHPINVCSRLAKGSVFSIELPLARQALRPMRERSGGREPEAPQRQGAILVIEDDPTLRETLRLTLSNEGYRTAAAANGPAALALVGRDGFTPDLIISDFVLPGGMNGARTAASVRTALGRQVPVVFLTGDIRSASLRDIDLTGSLRFTKPVKLQELSRAIRQLLTVPHADVFEASGPSTIFVIDDDKGVRNAMTELLETAGSHVEAYASANAFLAAYRADRKGCLVTDVRMPGMSGFELLARLRAAGSALPAIVITGHGDIAMAVEAMRAGAFDFIEKPVRSDELLACIERALQHAASPSERASMSSAAALRVAGLTRREREVMDHVIAGHANKEIAARLGIAQRTVETHRANVMKKMGAASISDLVRLVIGARGADPSS
jgi:two-component system CheB/CheR fusion protein